MFYIHPLEQPLIAAAIRLGEWCAASPELSDDDRKMVLSVVEALRRLPDVTVGVSGSFGFRFADDSVENWDETGEIPIGTIETWEVAYGPTSDTPGNLAQGQIWLEIFNHRFTYPQHEHDDLYDMPFELHFHRSSVDTTEKDYAGFSPGYHDLARIYDWISNTENVEFYRTHKKNFAIEV